MRFKPPTLTGLCLLLGAVGGCAGSHPVPRSGPSVAAAPVAGEPAPTLGERELEAYFAPVVASCAGGDAAACHRLAQRCHDLTNDREAARLMSALRQGCAHNVPVACASWGMGIARGVGVPADRAAGLALLQKTCTGGEGLACSELAEIYIKGELGLSGKEDEGRRLAGESCEKYGGPSCLSFAAALDQQADEARIVSLGGRACDGGDATACFSVGQIYAEGLGDAVKPDPARATDLYRRACDADFAQACFNLAWQYLRGTGAAKDERRGNDLLERACLLGDPSGCDEIARRGGDLRRACDRWGASACFELATKIAQTRGETADTAEELIALAGRACHRHLPAGCNITGHMARDYDRQCKAGTDVKDTCTFAGLFAADDANIAPAGSVEGAKFRASAVDQLSQACAAGSAPACRAQTRLGSSMPHPAKGK